MGRFIDRLLQSELFSEEFSATGKVLEIGADKVSIQLEDFAVVNGLPQQGVIGVGYQDAKLDVQFGETPKLVLLHGGNANLSRIIMDEGSRKRFLDVVDKGVVEVVYSMDSPRIKSVKGDGEFRFEYVGQEQVGKVEPSSVPKSVDTEAKPVLDKAYVPAIVTGAKHVPGRLVGSSADTRIGPAKRPYTGPTLEKTSLKSIKITNEDFAVVSGRERKTANFYLWQNRLKGKATLHDLSVYIGTMKATDEERMQAEKRFVDFAVDYVGNVKPDTRGLDAEESSENGVGAGQYVDNGEDQTRQAGREHGSPVKGAEVDDTIGIKEMLSLAEVHRVTLFRHIKKYGIEKAPGLGRYNRPQFMEYVTRRELGEPLELDLNGQYLPLVPVARALGMQLEHLRTTLEGHNGIELNDGQVNRDHLEQFVVKSIGSRARPKAETALLVIVYGRDRIAKIFTKYTD